MTADLVLKNAKIATLDADDRVVEAMACRGAHIIALGSDSEVSAWIGPETTVIDLEGRTAIPGIVDSHCHPDGYAARLACWREVSPANAPNRESLLNIISTAASELPEETWIACYRLNENKSGGYPRLAELDAAASNHPLFILRTDGHLGLANSAAFTALGITKESNDPEFGRFDRDPVTGELTGLVRETAAHLFLERIHGGDTPELIADGLEKVFAEWSALGITTVYNSLTPARAISAYQMLQRQGRLNMRIGIIASGREDGLVESLVATGMQSGFGDDWVRLIGVEWCPDCSTSGRTAAYYEPYVGTPIQGEPVPNTGILLYEADDLKARALAAHKAGLQVMIEGVGDRGIDFALDVLEATLEAHPVEDHRMRVEHCCNVTPAIMQRMKRLQVIDSSATGFMYDLGDAYIANRGADQMKYMWPHRSLIDAGVPAPGHSDAMICRAEPFAAIYAMVNRCSDTGGSLDQSEAVTVTEALKAYTILGAYAGREDHIKGTLEVGKLADIAVLDRDVFTIRPALIKDVQVATTILGGSVVFQA
ncbi:MAG: amidohydrolase [Rhodospirillaceae bacterium]|nr:amidohydrolase [Rhodospirillaceae bacterium]